MIVNAGREISQLPDIELSEFERDLYGRPRYMQIAGLGSDFADIFLAEEEIRAKRKRKLNDKLKVYVDQDLLVGRDVGRTRKSEFVKISGLDGEKIFIGFENLVGLC